MERPKLIRDTIRAVADFPKPGIVFRDIAPLLANPEAFSAVISILAERYRGKVEAVAGIDSRGFIFGATLAHELKIPFIMIRKPGKLPCKVRSQSYALEYGENTLELQEEAVTPGTKVLLLDDLLATGGSACAALDLLRSIGAEVVEVAFIIELAGLGGRQALENVDVFSIVTF